MCDVTGNIEVYLLLNWRKFMKLLAVIAADCRGLYQINREHITMCSNAISITAQVRKNCLMLIIRHYSSHPYIVIVMPVIKFYHHL